MEDLKLALVGYLNTKPFEYGLKTSTHCANFSVYYDTPANCVKLYQTDKVDVALVPVGALPDIDSYRIITDTCIGCDDYVRTVVLMSNDPITECLSIILDSHSRTSSLLTEILMNEYFRTDPTFRTERIDHLTEIQENQAVLMIGDKVFDNENKYKYNYDLGHLWKQHTGLPFAYAVWIARDTVSDEDIRLLSQELRSGVEQIDKVIKEEELRNHVVNLSEYYTKHIDYNLDQDKKKALQLYLQKVEQLNVYT